MSAATSLPAKCRRKDEVLSLISVDFLSIGMAPLGAGG